MTDHIGHFEIRGELGRGAMAVVWRAWDPRLEREVAIKEPVLPPGVDALLAAELGARFVREGKAAAKLNHPGIVTIHAADIYAGRPAIVMELIEGRTLGALLEAGPLPPATVLGLLDQLLEAVGYAHARGVVHRDIKPDNVFVSAAGRVRLSDFGIAHVGTAGATLTHAGTVMGTPGYMAPEQVTGGPVDARTDLFAIGALAYEMLSGENPFGASSGGAPTTVMYRIVHEDPPALPEGALAGLVVDLRPALAAALAKDPAARPVSAAALRAALRGGPLVTAAEAGADTGVTAALPAAAAVTLQQQALALTLATPQRAPTWWPYALVAAVALCFLAGLWWFAGRGSVSGGSPPLPRWSASPSGAAVAKVSPSPAGQQSPENVVLTHPYEMLLTTGATVYEEIGGQVVFVNGSGRPTVSVYVQDPSGQWLKVRRLPNGRRGWVEATYLKKPASPSPSPSPSPTAVVAVSESAPRTPFWGAFYCANHDRDKADQVAAVGETEGWNTLVLDTLDYDSLGEPGESMWVICAGPFDTEAEAEAVVQQMHGDAKRLRALAPELDIHFGAAYARIVQ